MNEKRQLGLECDRPGLSLIHARVGTLRCGYFVGEGGEGEGVVGNDGGASRTNL